MDMKEKEFSPPALTGEELRQWRKAQGFHSQEAFGNFIGTYITTVNAWENEKKNVPGPIRALVHVCKSRGIKLTDSDIISHFA